MSFLCTTFSLVLGLYFWRSNIVVSILISLAYLIFLFLRFGKKKFWLFLAFFAVGVVVPKIPIYDNNGPYSGMVIEARDNYVIFESKLTKYYVSCQDNDFEVGDYLVIEGNSFAIKFTNYESRFDFKNYLHNKGIDKELKSESIDIKYSSFIKVHAFKKSILSKLDQNAATLVSAFLFNEKDYSSDLIQHADNSGILYMFSLSGIYLNVLFSCLSYVLFIKFKKKTSKLLPFIILLPYAFFSFTKIGTLRVYGLYLLKYLNEFHFKRRKFTHIELVSLLALIFIIIDYHLVYQEAFYIGFILSVLSPLINNAVKCLTKRKRRVVYALLIRLFIIPIQISCGQLDILCFAKQVLLIPILTFFIILIITFIEFNITPFINKICIPIVWIVEKMDLVHIKIPFGYWSGITEIFLYGSFFLILYLLESVRIRHLKKVGLVIAIFILISVVPLQNPLTNKVSFINVGQGDSILIKNKNHTVMIDTGGVKSFDIATETLIPFMNKNKITHIDALITTHDDFDHSGGYDSLMQNFKVKKHLDSTNDFPYAIGDVYLQNLNTYLGDEENDKSLVLYMEFMNKKWLFMGDASTKVEKDILSKYKNLNCDIIKIGHHGSKTSTCEEFIKTVKPDTAIVSVGATNFYGHPNKEVIDLLTKYNVKIRRTDEEGTISYFSLVA